MVGFVDLVAFYLGCVGCGVCGLRVAVLGWFVWVCCLFFPLGWSVCLCLFLVCCGLVCVRCLFIRCVIWFSITVWIM